MPALLTRRNFLRTGAALGGSALVAAIGGIGYLATLDVQGLAPHDGQLNAFVMLEGERVTILVPRAEMGQGIHTGLAMVLAEEMDLPFDDRIRVVFPTAAHEAYSAWNNVLQVRPEEASGPVAWLGRRALGALGMIATGASGSMIGLWHPMRLAGATARAMLIQAAADRLGVALSSLTTGGGFVLHAASGQSLSYGELAPLAARLTPPEVRLKPRADWQLVGKPLPRLDIPDKIRGKPVYGIDVTLPGMIHAAIRQAPVFGATLQGIENEAEVRAAPGVLDLAVLDGRHVAVLARSWYLAEQAAGLLRATWTPDSATDSAALSARFEAALQAPDPHVHRLEGDISPPTVEARYSVPFVTHAALEPIQATVLLHPDGRAEIWASSQSPMAMRQGVARGMGWAGVSPREVTPHVTMNGGAFGRRSDQDVYAQAACLAAMNPGRPVKLIWSREEDMSRGLYRSAAAARLQAALGPDGLPQSLDALVAGQSVIHSVGRRNLPVTPPAAGDALVAEGLDKPFYAIPNRRIRTQDVASHVPIHFWRSNGYSCNTFFTESFLDECAWAAGQDPLDYRRALLRDSPRHLAVLDRVAALADWGAPLPPGRGRGIAIEACYGSVVAQVAEVTVLPDGELRLDRVCCALDAGVIINPDSVRAQMEGGILFAATTALVSAITLDRGAVVETNFHDYPILRLANAPAIEVALIDSDLPPTGVGEPGVVPTAAAIANAIQAATGRRLRHLPLTRPDFIGERQIRCLLPPSEA